jgi:hypothetical protein
MNSFASHFLTLDSEVDSFVWRLVKISDITNRNIYICIYIIMSHQHHSSFQQTNVGPMSDISTNQPNTRAQQLRRAIYIHVSDLTSTYNINSSMLEEELIRVKAERENQLSQENVSTRLFSGVPTELDTSSKKRLQSPRGGSNLVLYVYIFRSSCSLRKQQPR